MSLITGLPGGEEEFVAKSRFSFWKRVVLLFWHRKAAAAGDRAAMVYLGKAYDTGKGLGTRSPSWLEAVYWYTQAVETVESSDEEGNYDGTMDDPTYQLLARLAEMYRDGGPELEANPSEAGIISNLLIFYINILVF